MLLFWVFQALIPYGWGGAELFRNGVPVPKASWEFAASMIQSFFPFWLGSTAALLLAPRWIVEGRVRWWATIGWTWLFATLFCAGMVWSSSSSLGEGLIAYVTAMPITLIQAGAFVAAGVVWQLVGQAAARERLLQQAQLQSLRSQLQPHFLFNTLHAIGVMATRDGAAAARMTTLLGDMLRHTLRERRTPLVPLADEQELLRPYLQLQQLRFQDRLRVQCDLPRELHGALVPDLLLQPLVENALQHGIEQRPGAGSVTVSARRAGPELVIEVKDDGVPTVGAPERLGTGLTATRERLRVLFGSRASLALRANDDGGTTAIIRLPFRESHDAA
jgi:Histidine kinase